MKKQNKKSLGKIFSSLSPVSSPVTTNNKGTFLGRLLGKSMCEECLAQGQAHSEKSFYIGCSNC